MYQIFSINTMLFFSLKQTHLILILWQPFTKSKWLYVRREVPGHLLKVSQTCLPGHCCVDTERKTSSALDFCKQIEHININKCTSTQTKSTVILDQQQIKIYFINIHILI